MNSKGAGYILINAAIVLSLSTVAANAQPPNFVGEGSEVWDRTTSANPLAQEEIYGGAMMTKGERKAYRDRLHEFETEAERNEFRAAHKEAMDQRAWSMGFKLDGQGRPLGGVKNYEPGPRKHKPTGGGGHGGH